MDIDPTQILRSHMPQLGLVGDAGQAASWLAAHVPARSANEGAARAAAANAGRLALPPMMQADLNLLDLLRDTLPASLVVGDSTQLVYAGNSGFAAGRPGGYFNSATGFGTLGYGLPAAIGAALASPDHPVVALVGDGGLQFSLAELTSAVEARARVIVLLHDNSGYGEIKSYMQSQSIPPLGVDILTPDLVAIARACGWQTDRVQGPDDLAHKLTAAATADTPCLLILDDAARRRFA